MTSVNVVVWLNQPSHYQTAFFRELVSRPEVSLSVVYAGDVAPGDYDLVCCFGVLHHVPEPGKVVCEMLRVAGKAVLISDSNNFGQGRPLIRLAKQCLHRAGLWRLATLIQTRGKGYHTSESDGLFYSYSVCDNHEQVRRACARTYWLGTQSSGADLYRTAGHVALLGVK